LSLDKEFSDDDRGSMVVKLGVEEMIVPRVRVPSVVSDVGLD
jgi:hypothetical protein